MSHQPPRAARPPAIIGIVGGVGPFAGLDLQHKILEQTAAARDQDHLPVISVSWPGPIPDRTEFLLGRVAENPAYPILNQLRLLAGAGATVAGVPCNSAHAPAIFDVVRAGVAGFERPLRLLHMIEEAVVHLQDRILASCRVFRDATTGRLRKRPIGEVAYRPPPIELGQASPAEEAIRMLREWNMALACWTGVFRTDQARPIPETDDCADLVWTFSMGPK